MNDYIAVLKKYAVFEGRASRKEYWMFFLFNFIISFVLGFVCGLIQASSGIALDMVPTLYALAILLPSFGVAIRRMHDTDRSGWWCIVPIVNIVFAVMPGDQGENRYGEDPYASEAAEGSQLA